MDQAGYVQKGGLELSAPFIRCDPRPRSSPLTPDNFGCLFPWQRMGCRAFWGILGPYWALPQYNWCTIQCQVITQKNSSPRSQRCLRM